MTEMTKEEYIARMRGAHLHLAKRYHTLKDAKHMWAQLIAWAYAKDFYDHYWDALCSRQDFLLTSWMHE